MNLTWWIGRAMSSNSVLVGMLRVYLLLLTFQFVHSNEYDSALDNEVELMLMLPNLEIVPVCAGTNQSFELLGMGFIGDKLMMIDTGLAFLEMPKSALDTATNEWALYDATRDTVENRWTFPYEMMKAYLRSNTTMIKTIFTGENEQKKIIFPCEGNDTDLKSYFYFDVDDKLVASSHQPESLEQVSPTYISVERDYSFVFAKTDKATILVVFNLNFNHLPPLDYNFNMSLCKGPNKDQIRIEPFGTSNLVINGCRPLTDWDIQTTSLYIDGLFYLFGLDEVYMFPYDPIEHQNDSTTVTFKTKSFKDFFKCFRPPPPTTTTTTTTTPVPTNATIRPSSSTTTGTDVPPPPSPSPTVGPTDGSSSKTSASTSPPPTKAPQPKPEPETRLTSDNVTVTSETTTAKSSLTMIIIIVLVLIVALIILFVLYCLCCRKKKEDEKKADDKSKKKPVTDKKSSAKDKKDDKKQTKSGAKSSAVVGAGKTSKGLVKSSVKGPKSSSKGLNSIKGSLSAGNAFKSRVSTKGGMAPKEKQTIGLDKYSNSVTLSSNMNSSTLSKQSSTGNSSVLLTTGTSNDFGSSVISKASTVHGAGGSLSKAGSSSISNAGASVRSVNGPTKEKIFSKSASRKQNNPAPSKKTQAKNAVQPKSSAGKSSASKKNK